VGNAVGGGGRQNADELGVGNAVGGGGKQNADEFGVGNAVCGGGKQNADELGVGNAFCGGGRQNASALGVGTTLCFDARREPNVRLATAVIPALTRRSLLLARVRRDVGLGSRDGRDATGWNLELSA
jgi:hypothetical protein